MRIIIAKICFWLGDRVFAYGWYLGPKFISPYQFCMRVSQKWDPDSWVKEEL